MRLPPKTSFALLSALVVALAGAGCGSDTPSNSTVNVTLREFVVAADQATAPNGSVTFRVSNIGTVPHEFLVIKTDLDQAALPIEPNGSYNENGPGTSLLDEIDSVSPGETKTLTLTLVKAKYVLICNMVHDNGDGTVIAHYQRGMHTAFTVN